jgi:hypothetical protein
MAIEGCAYQRGEHEAVILPESIVLKPLFDLPLTVITHGLRGEPHAATLVGLRCSKGRPVLGGGEYALDLKRSSIQVDVAPLQLQKLTLP